MTPRVYIELLGFDIQPLANIPKHNVQYMSVHTVHIQDPEPHTAANT